MMVAVTNGEFDMFKKWRIGILVLVTLAFSLAVTTGCPPKQGQKVNESQEVPKGDHPKH
jgi:hypothetical protein